MVFRPDGKQIASGDLDGRIWVWDVATGKDLLSLEGHTAKVSALAFSPDGKRIASASRDDTVRVWDVATGKDLFALKGESNFVDSVAFSPDGARVTLEAWNYSIRLWNFDTRKEVLTFKGHPTRFPPWHSARTADRSLRVVRTVQSDFGMLAQERKN